MTFASIFLPHYPVLEVAFAQSVYIVREDEGQPLVCVTVTANEVALGQSATVFITSTEINAFGIHDYE